MAQNRNRSNHVKIDNLPPHMTNCRELLSHLELAGNVQDLVAISPTSVVASYQMRMMAEQAVFALNGLTMSSGNQIAVSLFFPQNDPQFASSPTLQSLGRYIGQDHIRFNAANFHPWTPAQPSHHQQQQQHYAPAGQQPVANPASQWSGQQTQPFGQMFNSGAIQPGGGGNHNFLNNFLPNYLPSGGTLFGSQVPPTQPNPPPASQPNPANVLVKHTKEWLPVEPWDQCTICLGDMDRDGGPCRELNLCHHRFHRDCLEQMLKNSPSPFLQCPICKKVHGVRTGNRPTHGSMMIHRLENDSLPGHEGHGTIAIQFHFKSGVQGPEHPSPGQPYTAHNFPRVAYLPDTPDGCRALHGLYLAWEQRLLFTVGTSLTTNQSNCVTWNDIHLKTYKSGPNHSYPDPNFLSNLMQELAGFGITEAEIGSHMTAHPNLKTRGRL